jgi:hypothetical protein
MTFFSQTSHTLAKNPILYAQNEAADFAQTPQIVQNNVKIS